MVTCIWIHFGSDIVPILRGIVVSPKNHKGKNNTVVWVTCVQFVANNGFTLTVTYCHRVTRSTFSARAACALDWKPSPSLPTLPPIDTPNCRVSKKKQSCGKVGGRKVVEVRIVIGVFTFYFVGLQSTKFIHHKNIILLVCIYYTLFATIANLKLQCMWGYYPAYLKINFVSSR